MKGSDHVCLVPLSELDINNYNKVLEFRKALKSKQVKIDSSAPLPKSSLDDRDQDSTVVHKLQRQYRRFNQEEIEQIIEGYKKGVTMAELARRFDCHKATIKRRLREAGVK